MPRLFTAIAVPAFHTEILRMAQSGLKQARWIEPSDMHITLRFIGDVDTRTANDISEALAVRNWIAPEIQLRGFDVFGGKKPRSVYAKIVENAELTGLQLAQERLMQTMGLPPAQRKFTPHITIARLRSAHTPLQVAHYLSARSEADMEPFTPKQFHLYSAKASTGGGPYRIEQSFDFGP